MEDNKIDYIPYTDESMLKDVHKLVSKDLSEPYSVFTYRYFLHNWPNLCICAYATENVDKNDEREMKTERKLIGTIVCKLENNENNIQSGYIAMLAVDVNYRKRGIGMKLVYAGIDNMISMGCREVILETEASNKGALSLYTKLGFVKEEKLARYYLNGGDAYRLKLFVDKITPTSTNGEDIEDGKIM